LLKRLEAQGLVRRRRDAGDERQVLIALTPQGRALHERARAVPRGVLDAAGCSVDQVRALKQQLVALRDQLMKEVPA
jgi:DNA-binding MarR family transcriptional regulator